MKTTEKRNLEYLQLLESLEVMLMNGNSINPDSVIRNAIQVAIGKEVNQNKMKRITKSVIKLSEIPKHLQHNEVLQGHKLHTYAEFHIDDSEKDELTLWLLSQFPTIKRNTSFLIHIDNL